MLEKDEDMRELLAFYAHEAWCGWMEYLFKVSTGEPRPDDAVVIPATLVARWKRQIDTAYPDLSEEDKISDRAEADKILGMITAYELAKSNLAELE